MKSLKILKLKISWLFHKVLSTLKLLLSRVFVATQIFLCLAVLLFSACMTCHTLSPVWFSLLLLSMIVTYFISR